jgi:hypothetical protein
MRRNSIIIILTIIGLSLGTNGFTQDKTEPGVGDLAGKTTEGQEINAFMVEMMSSFLVDYPFTNRLYPGSLAALAHVRPWGATVILSDGDVKDI